MTEAQLQQAIHSLYEGDTDVPSEGEEDYTVRTRLMNAAINRWEHEDGILWNELKVDLTDAADGDKTTSDGTLVYDCPTDFKFIEGYVRLVDSGDSTYFTVVPAEKLQLFDNEDKKICSIIGNPKDGYDLKFLDDPDGAYTIKYSYYKNADTLSATTDVPEMSDPYFIVYFVLSRLYENDNRLGLATKSFQEAEARLRQMRARNMQSGWYQDSRVEDYDTEQGVGGFGV